MYPQIKLLIDVQKDLENAQWFVKNGEYVDWFLPADFQYITNKDFSSRTRNKIIAEYTKQQHLIKQKKLLAGLAENRKRWAQVEKKYFQLIEKIFPQHPWPKGQYLGYISIYLMYPRNLQDKTFFLSYSREKWDPIGTIGHELLHFIFFDYLHKHYKIKQHDLFQGKNPKYIWQISETFNTVIENWPPYKKIFSAKNDCRPYPGCESMYKKMSQQWKTEQNLPKLLDKWLGKLKKIK